MINSMVILLVHLKRKDLLYGHWLEHSLGWLGERHHNIFLITTYETLKNNIEAEIIRIATFCDKRISPDTGNFIINHTTLD